MDQQEEKNEGIAKREERREERREKEENKGSRGKFDGGQMGTRETR
jgi:hypothetical protein